MDKEMNVFVAGHLGMVGSAISEKLALREGVNVITACRGELDLLINHQVETFFNDNAIDYVVLAAARVGGIHGNNVYPAEFIYQNLMIEANIIHNAWKAGVYRLLFLGSSCIYPRLSKQPMKEEELLNGYLEPTNEPYAIAKISGIKLCESYNRQYGTQYRSIMPTNLYGPNDYFHIENSHVIPALIRKFHLAKVNGAGSVKVWGSGNAKREFLHVSDMADASVYVMNVSDDDYWGVADERVSHINVGVGEDVSIRDLAFVIKGVVGYDGEIVFDSTRPEGPPRKLLDCSRMEALGWRPSISLYEGLASTYKWFLANQDNYRN